MCMPLVRPPVTVVIFARDQAGDVTPCLASCDAFDDIHVIDCGRDAVTPRLSAAATTARPDVKCHACPETSPLRWRNWALENIPAPGGWQLHLAANERATPKLATEIHKELAPGGLRGGVPAFLIPTQTMFMGRWIRFSSLYPDYRARLVHRDRLRFSDSDDQIPAALGNAPARLVWPVVHLAGSGGLAEWLRGHNRDSDEQAAMETSPESSPHWTDLLNPSSARRRRARRALAGRLRPRPLWRFIYLYLARFGWLDGYPGLHYCAAAAMYDYWIELKLAERRQNWSQANEQLTRRLLGNPGAAPQAMPAGD